MSFVNITSDAYSASVIFVPYAKSSDVGPRYNGTPLYYIGFPGHLLAPDIKGLSLPYFYTYIHNDSQSTHQMENTDA